jgi:hypothetical protein
VLILAGCVATGPSLRVAVNPHAPQYVRTQIIGAMRSAGYQKVHFSSFRTAGNVVPEVRGADFDEYRFAREGDGGFVARVVYDKQRSTVTVRLVDAGAAGAGESVRAELDRIGAVLDAELGEVAVRR